MTDTSAERHRSRPRFTIGIPTFNRAESLKRAVATALNQTYNDIEIIISDNASTDGTSEVVRAWSGRVRYCRNATNLGAFLNLQKVVELAEGEYFIFLQDDDLLHRDFARRAADALAQSESLFAYIAYAIVTPSPTSMYLPQLYGPQVALDWMDGGVRIVDGRSIAPLSLFASVAIPPPIAFRTDRLRAACALLDPACMLYSERIMLSVAAAGGMVAIDPWPAAVFTKHQAQTHVLMRRQDASAEVVHWERMIQILENALDLGALGEEFLTSLFEEIAVEHRRLWINAAAANPGWKTAPASCRRVRDILAAVACRTDKTLHHHRGGVRPRLGKLVHSITPPVVWQAGKEIRRRMARSR